MCILRSKGEMEYVRVKSMVGRINITYSVNKIWEMLELCINSEGTQEIIGTGSPNDI